MLKALIFDMDGVIIDSQPIADRLLKSACEDVGIFLSDEELTQLTGLSLRKFWTHLKQKYHLPESIEYYKSLYRTDLEIKAYDELNVDLELIRILEFVRLKMIKTAVATSASQKRMQAALNHFGLQGYFDAVICDQDVTQSKPAPDVFLAAAQAMEVGPEHCVVIEDTDTGILASKNAGMRCFLYTKYTLPGELSKKAEFVFNDFNALKQKIGQELS